MKGNSDMSWVYDDIPAKQLTKEQKRLLNLHSIADKYEKIYDSLYNCEELEDLLMDFEIEGKLIDKAEEYFKTEEGKEFIKEWYEEFNDVFTSDRELIAICIAKLLYL